MARHANQQPLTVQPDPGIRHRTELADDLSHLNAGDAVLIGLGTKLPNRYWLRSEHGWYSVPRSSPEAQADRASRFIR